MGSDEIKSDQIGSGENRRYQMIVYHISLNWFILYDIWFDLIRPEKIRSYNIGLNQIDDIISDENKLDLMRSYQKG